jgi:hypothetical protein
MPKFNALDIQQLVESALTAFCEQFELTSRQDRQRILTEIAATARAMKGQQ